MLFTGIDTEAPATMIQVGLDNSVALRCPYLGDVIKLQR
jgi:hypothetical protein